MATVKRAATQRPLLRRRRKRVSFKGEKTTNYGLVNKYDVRSAGRMQGDDVITTCHSTCHLTTGPTGATTNTARSGSPRDQP